MKGFPLKMDIIKTLEILKKLELKARDLYEFYNKTFIYDREAAGVFYGMSLDEKSHADMLDYQIRMVRKNRAMFKDVDIDLEEVSSMIGRIGSSVSAPVPPSLGEALTLAIEFEVGACEYHYCTLLIKSNPDVAPLIRALGSSDREHAGMLRELAMRRGIINPAVKEPHDVAPVASLPVASPSEALMPYQVKIVTQMIEVEQLIAVAYEEFSRMFPEHSTHWEGIAKDEWEHAHTLEALKENVLSGAAGFDEGKTRTYTLTAMIDYVKGILDRARKGQLSARQAVSLSIDIEKSIIEKDAFSHFTGLTPEIEASLARLHADTVLHADRLRAMLGVVA